MSLLYKWLYKGLPLEEALDKVHKEFIAILIIHLFLTLSLLIAFRVYVGILVKGCGIDVDTWSALAAFVADLFNDFPKDTKSLLDFLIKGPEKLKKIIKKIKEEKGKKKEEKENKDKEKKEK